MEIPGEPTPAKPEREKKFECLFCSTTCTDQFNMTRHLRCHSGEKPYKCEFCGFRTSYSSNLKMHLFTFHEKITEPRKFKPSPRNIPCTNPECEKKFASSRGLAVHLKFHTSAKNFECNQCSVKFVTKSQLMFHRRVHFTLADDLKFQLQIEQEEQLTENFICSKCNKKYQRRGGWLRHRWTHFDKEKEMEMEEEEKNKQK